MNKKKILVVDDERDLVDILVFNLQREQYAVITAGDGELAVAMAERERPDLILLDLMLPGIDGLEVCRRLRANPRTAGVPIIMLTAKGEEMEAVIGLSQGADDYVRKPFSVRELMARVAARLRRGTPAPVADRDDSTITCGELVIDGARFEASVAGQTIPLTPTEFKLLRQLARRPGRVFTRDELREEAPLADSQLLGRSVDVHVSAIRRKLGPFGRRLETVRGVGYRLQDPADDD